MQMTIRNLTLKEFTFNNHYKATDFRYTYIILTTKYSKTRLIQPHKTPLALRWYLANSSRPEQGESSLLLSNSISDKLLGSCLVWVYLFANDDSSRHQG